MLDPSATTSLHHDHEGAAAQPASTPVPASALRLRKASDRGRSDHGWLRSAFSFSFADYFDPAHSSFGALRVINDDRIAPRGGFPMHPHRNFDIFSYVLEGQIAHRDSMGNGSTVAAGGVQFMSAGSGVRHSEVNPSADEPLRILQVWLSPAVLDGAPRYEVLGPEEVDRRGRLAPIITQSGQAGTIKTHAPADVYAGRFTGEEAARFTVRTGPQCWVQVANGSLSVAGLRLSEGDGLAITASGEVSLADGEDAEILLFDLEAEAPSAG